MRARLVQQVQSATRRRVEEPRGIAQDGFEHRLLVRAGLADDLQDLSRRRLALQRILKRGVIANLCL